MRRHRKDLLEVPVAMFGIGQRQGTDEAWLRSRAQLDKALAKRGWLHPVTSRAASEATTHTIAPGTDRNTGHG